MNAIITSFVAIATCVLGIDIPTAHVDNSRTGANLNETRLTPANVTAGIFVKLGSYSVDGNVYGDPLFLQHITIGGSTYDVLIVVTMHNSIYAFDANRPGSAALWSRLAIATSRTSYPDVSVGPLVYGEEVGCLSTPAADTSLNVVFVACHTSTPAHILYKLNLSTGATVSSVTITGQYPGTGDSGDSTSGGNLLFNAAFEFQRSALTVANGNVYIAFGAYADVRPWHGWLFAYSESTLIQVAVFCTSPNAFGAGLWGASGGPSVDANGNLYMLTGNGTYDGITSFGESILKWSPSLTLLDWFTPSNWSTLNGNDSDLSSGRAMLIPGTTLMVGGAKDFKVYLLDTTCMGHLQGGGSGCPSAQVFATNASGTITDHSGIYGGTFYNNRAFFPNTGGKIYAFDFSTGSFNTTPTTTSGTFEFPGAQMSASGNGASNGIIWATTVATSALYVRQAGTMRALNPFTLAEYWNSTGTGDALGTVSKFVVPVVANGRVYVGTLDNVVHVYGLLASMAVRGNVAIRGNTNAR